MNHSVQPLPYLSRPVRLLYWIAWPQRMREIRKARVEIVLEQIAALPTYEPRP